MVNQNKSNTDKSHKLIAENLLIQFEDVDGKTLSEVIQVPTIIDLPQLKSLIDTNENLYINGNLITTDLKNALTAAELNDGEQILKIKLSADEKSSQTATYCSSSYSGHEGAVLKTKFVTTDNDDKMIMVSAGGDKTVRFWDLLTRTQFKVVEKHTHWVLHIDSNKTHVFSAGMDSLICVYDFKGNFIKSFAKQKLGITNLVCIKDTNMVISTARDGSAYLFKVGSDADVEVIGNWKHSTAIASVEVDYKNMTIFTGSNDGVIKVHKYDSKAIDFLHNLKGHTTKVNAIRCFGTSLVTCDDLGQIIVWKGLKVHMRILSAHKREIISLDIAPNGINFVTGSFDKTVKIWNIDNGTNLATFYHVNFVYKVRFYNDLVISCSKDKMIRMFRPSTKKIVSDLVVDDEVFDFDYNGGLIVAGLRNSKVYFFN